MSPLYSNMVKKKLDWNLETDFVLMGFYTQQRLYRLAWMLNNGINSNFSRVSDIKLNLHGNSAFSEHHTFIFENEEEEWALKLVQNQGSLGILVKHNPAPLAILKVHGALSRIWLERIELFAKDTIDIQFFEELEIDKIKNKETIIFDV